MFYSRINHRLSAEFGARNPQRLARLLACTAAIACSTAMVCACATSPRGPGAESAAAGTGIATGDAHHSDTDAGDALLRDRLANPGDSDRPLGPGDVLKINVPGTDEYNDFTVRISGEGTINAPLVGVMPAAGLSEDALAHQLTDRLRKYVRNAQVQIFVQEYRSNQVGVFGAVTRPGVYDITGGGDTLQDMIAQAGGLTPAAARRIDLIPGRSNPARPIAPQIPGQADGSDGDDRISIDLSDPLSGRYLSAPAHFGDVIFVPELGQVLVEGWVEKPGSYSITPGLRILGAIGAAGGALYPADLESVELVRVKPNGRKEVKSVDLTAVETGESRDLLVDDADVIQVGYNTAKVIPYGIYQAFTDVFHVGAYVAPALP
jgi:polysaccharide biosynthesis/export protein